MNRNKPINWLFILLLFFAAKISHAATYDLPSDVSSGAFDSADCSVTGANEITCTGNLTLSNNGDAIVLEENLTLYISGNFIIEKNNVEINSSGAYSLSIILNGNFEAENSNGLNVVADLTLDGSFEVKNNLEWQGDIDADGSIETGNGADIVGDLTSEDDINFGNESVVTGTCTADGGNYASFCSGESSTPEQIAFFELSESDSWTGVAGEIDDSLNNLDGVAFSEGSAQIADADDASSCLAGLIPNNDSSSTQDAIDTGIDIDDVGSTGTILFWYQSSSSADSVRQLLDASTRINKKNGSADADESKMFFLTLDGDDLHFRLEDSDDDGRIAEISNVTTNDSGGDPAWVFMAVSWDFTNDEQSVYILEPDASSLRSATNTSSSSGEIGELDTLYIGDNRSTYLPGVSSGNSADGYFDDVRVFTGVLTETEILSYANTVRICDATPTTCFYDDFDDGDLGSDWALTNQSEDTSVFENPFITGGRLRMTGEDNQLATAATLMRLFPTEGNKIVVDFTLYVYGGDEDDGGSGIAVVLSSDEETPQPGGFGHAMGYAQSTAASDPNGFAGGWVGISIDKWGNYVVEKWGKEGGFDSKIPDTVAIRGSGSGKDGYEYITANGIDFPDTTTEPESLDPGVYTDTAGHDYRITIDHETDGEVWISVERDEDLDGEFTTFIESFDIMENASQDAVPDNFWLTITGATQYTYYNIHEIDDLSVCAHDIDDVSTEYIDHYELDRDSDQGLTCEPINIEVRACLDDDCDLASQYSDSITTTFLPATGWESSATKTNYSSGDSFAFQQTTAGTYTLGINDTSTEYEPLTADEDEVLCFVSGIEQSDCDVSFVDTAYRFFESASGSSSISTIDLIAAQTSSDLYLRAIETDEATGECVSVDASIIDVASLIGTSCSSTDSCLTGEQVVWTQSASDTSLANPTDQSSGSDYSNIDISFGSNDTATFNVTAPDVGVQPLSVSSEILDIDDSSTGEFITGTLNLRVRPASIEVNTNVSGTYTAADDFTTTISARDADGRLTPSFGRITGLYGVEWTGSTIASPTGGTLGSISGGSDSSDWSGVDESTGSDGITESIQASMSYSEVGEVNLQANIEDFLGSGVDLTSSDSLTGRFIPAFITATQNNAGTPDLGTEDTNLYQGQSTSLYNLSYSVQAFNAEGDAVNNYVGSYVSFASSTDALDKPTGTSSVGGDLTSGSFSWTISDDSDFDGSITLTADVPDVLWDRNSAGATTDDVATTVADLTLQASAFTDADGICVMTSASDTACLDVSADIEDRTLYFVRASLPSQVDASSTEAFIEITLEELVIDSGGDITFETLTSDNDLDNTTFAGLDVINNYCSTSTACATAVSSAAFTGPDGSGTTLSSSLGLFTVNSATELSGIIEVQLDAPDWLSWDWDDDGSYTLDTTTMLFGEYQGNAPVLFIRPGFR